MTATVDSARGTELRVPDPVGARAGQDLRPGRRPRRRRPRPLPRRGAGRHRRQRRRQVHADQVPHRRATSPTPGEILLDGQPVTSGGRRTPERPASRRSTRHSRSPRRSTSRATSTSPARSAARARSGRCSGCSTRRACATGPAVGAGPRHPDDPEHPVRPSRPCPAASARPSRSPARRRSAARSSSSTSRPPRSASRSPARCSRCQAAARTRPAVILISHNMPHVWEVADRIHIQRLGRCAGVITPQSHTMSEGVAIMTGATSLTDPPPTA